MCIFHVNLAAIVTFSLVMECDDLSLVAELLEQSDLIDVGILDISVNVLQVDLLEGICLVV